jgi:ketosteroid isomerase-like protein
MKRILIIAMLALAACSAALAQVKGKSDAPSVEKQLMKLEQDLVDALVRGDTALWERSLADSFVFTAPDGATQTKAQVLSDFKNGVLKMESSTNDDMKVRAYGNAAVVTYRSTDKGTYHGRDIGGQYRWTDVFVKRNGRWQIVSTQGTPLAAK